MKNKVFVRVFSKIEKLQNKRTTDINRCKDIIAANETKIQEASEKITVNADIDDFLIASENRAKAEAAVKACKDKIRLLENEGLISEEEYEEDVKAIRSEQQKIADEAFKAIVPLMKQMFKLYDDMNENVEKFNDLIKSEADVAKHNLGAAAIVTYNDDKYDLVKGNVGRLKYQMEHHMKLADYFTQN